MKSGSLLKFGRTIRKLREQKGWSQEELAEHADLHRNYASSVERGERNLSFQNISKIASAFGLKPSELFKMAGF